MNTLYKEHIYREQILHTTYATHQTLSQTDLDAAVEAAGKKKKKVVKQMEDGKVVEVDTRFYEVALDRYTKMLYFWFVYLCTDVPEPLTLNPKP